MLLLQLAILSGFLGTNIPFAQARSLPSLIPTATPQFSDQPTATTPILIQRQTSPTTTPAPGNEKGYYISTEFVTILGFTNEHVTKHDQTITIAIPTCLATAIPDKNGYVPPGECGSYYRYYPSFGAAVATAALFGLLTVGHVVLAVRYSKKFCWVIIMGSLWEALGFAIRTASTKNQQVSALVLISQIFVLLVPLWVNAFIYMLLSRLIYLVSPTHSVLRIPAQLLSVIFVGLDFVTFVIQLIGGSMAGPTAQPEEQMKAIHIYMGGIGLQQFFIIIFVGIAIKFQLDMRKLEKSRSVGVDGSWKTLLWAVYAGLGFITIRIIYRLIEFSGGREEAKNPLPFKEVYIYVLEVLPMFFAIAIFLVVHPGKVLKGHGAEMPGLWATFKGRKEQTARSKERKIVDEEGHELVSKYKEIRRDTSYENFRRQN